MFSPSPFGEKQDGGWGGHFTLLPLIRQILTLTSFKRQNATVLGEGLCCNILCNVVPIFVKILPKKKTFLNVKIF